MNTPYFILLLLSVTPSLLAQVYQCNYTQQVGYTKIGANLGNMVSAISVAGCANVCCQNTSCAGASFVTSQNACYLKSTQQFSSESTTTESGTTLITLANRKVCTSCTQPTNFQCKRGLAYGFNSITDMSALKAGIKWYYNWSPQPNSGVLSQNLGIEFVPMVWGGNFNVNTVISQIPSSSKYLLTFNEPNFFSQSNLSPAQAAALWPKIQQIASAKKLKIVSPGVNYCGPASSCWATDPVAYLKQFFGNCTNCQVDYVAAHFYPGSCGQPYFDNLLAQLTQFNRPIWLTEFSCSGASSFSVQNSYMQLALNDLENNVNVFRYAWFSGRDTNVPYSSVLNTAPGSLTTLGTTFTTYLVGQQQCPSTSTTTGAQAIADSEWAIGSVELSVTQPKSVQPSTGTMQNSLVVGVVVAVIAVVIIVIIVVILIKKQKSKKEERV